MKSLLFIQILILFAFSSCEGNDKKTIEEAEPQLPHYNLHSHWVDSVYQSLTLEEKIGQLIWGKGELSDSIIQSFSTLPLGALITDASKENFASLKTISDSNSAPVLFGCSNWFWPYTFEKNNWQTKAFSSISDTSYLSAFYDSTVSYLTDLGIGLVLHSCDTINRMKEFDYIIDEREKIIFSKLLNKSVFTTSLSTLDTVHKKFTNEIVEIDFSGNTVSNSVSERTLFISGTSFEKIKNQTDTLISIVKKGNKIVLINNMTGIELLGIQQAIQYAASSKLIAEKDIEINVRKVLALKELSYSKRKSANSLREFEKKHIISLRSFQYQCKYKSTILLQNKNNIVPLKDWNSNDNIKWIKIGNDPLKYITPAIANYADAISTKSNVKNLALDQFKKSDPLIIVINENLDAINAELLQDKINLYANQQNIILVNIKHEENLQYLDSLPCLLHVWNDDNYSQELLAQAIFGGVALDGKLPITFGKYSKGTGLICQKTRLAYSIPEVGGFNRDSLRNLDNIAREAIFNQVTPGCQVLAVRKGNVVYNKTFGYHTYERNIIVNQQDAYDIASVTKVAATTLCGMKLYEQGLYQLSDSLKDHLPDSLTRVLHHRSRLSDITFQELFTHKSGLPAGLPIYKFIAYVDSVIGKFDRYFCDESNHDYCVEVAKNFYLDSAYLDSLWIDLNRIWPGDKNYKYSDANMNVLYQIFRSKLKQSYHEYLANTFYRPLKLRATTYLPLDYLDTLKHIIAPTEYDTYWRYQLLKGSVHDPNAALYGGVAGNAGLFSNANELAVLFQMLMNGGNYGGKQYLQPATIKKFTIHQLASHRGLGFDKPTGQSTNTVAPDCPNTAFGHTGFTGICVWADPENDMLFVFVSNRVHPDPNNKKIITYGTRKRLHQVFYNQLRYTNQYRNKQQQKTPIKSEV